jgi:hypothetical protein
MQKACAVTKIEQAGECPSDWVIRRPAQHPDPAGRQQRIGEYGGIAKTAYQIRIQVCGQAQGYLFGTTSDVKTVVQNGATTLSQYSPHPA